jgi:hypothetical protein
LNDNDDADINRTWESITQNIKTSATQNLGYYKLNQHKNVMMKSAQIYDNEGSRLNAMLSESKPYKLG